MREATLPALPERKVKWVRYTGDNIDELKDFCDVKTFFIADDDSKTLYWKELDKFIKIGDFIVQGDIGGNNWIKHRVISWKTFPRMIKENIPIFMNDYLTWENDNPHIQTSTNE